ncbi:amino acid ABC transporter permease [Maritalea porphyrae]|jgi:polar amino acid transport system permease protein|uniref:amino acid ABC transporter permease n=1 Tax=Maritalea porphyrae TaxID=880732 RepID=UPI0022AF2248|nr:amino acid ABC transporter permease [Maritalea porphyrae]MCZ4271267.1 amino acid ABC transporter permease [Maritalea porphyrae]
MVTLTNGLRRGAPRLKAAFIFAIVPMVFALSLGLNRSGFGQLFLVAMNEQALAGWWGSASVSLVIYVLAVGSFLLLLALPSLVQQFATWILLAAFAMGAFYSFDLSYAFIGKKLPFLLSQGLVTTIYVSALSISLAFVLALLGATAKMSGIGILQGVGGFYTSYFRGVPLLVQLFLIYLGLPQIGIVVEPIPAAIAALGLVYGAYMTEIFRSGIQSISLGQWEAADALGLSRLRTFQKVIMPQAMRFIVPPTGNQFIAMLKDSSLVSVVGVWDIMFIARTQGRADFRILEMLITVSVVYWLLSMVLEYVQHKIEIYYSRSLKR